MWSPGINLRSPGLLARVFNYWGIAPALNFFTFYISIMLEFLFYFCLCVFVIYADSPSSRSGQMSTFQMSKFHFPVLKEAKAFFFLKCVSKWCCLHLSHLHLGIVYCEAVICRGISELKFSLGTTVSWWFFISGFSEVMWKDALNDQLSAVRLPYRLYSWSALCFILVLTSKDIIEPTYFWRYM